MDIKGVSGWKTTGFSGSFEIYAATSDLARLVVETDQLPPDTHMCHTRTTLDYQFMLIGDSEFLLPRRSELETFDTDAGQTDSVTAFLACHEYTAESTIRFDDRDSSPNPAKSAPALTTVLPSGISLTLALLRPIDTRNDAAGDTVSAKDTRAIRAPDSKAILVPAGAIARGRILQMRYQYSTSRLLISIRFDTLEIQGVISQLSLRLDRDLKPAKPSNSRGLRTRAPEFSLPPPAPMETGSLLVFLARSSTLVVPADFQSKWITVAP